MRCSEVSAATRSCSPVARIAVATARVLRYAADRKAVIPPAMLRTARLKTATVHSSPGTPGCQSSHPTCWASATTRKLTVDTAVASRHASLEKTMPAYTATRAYTPT